MSRPQPRCDAPASIRSPTSPRANCRRARRSTIFCRALRGEADIRRVLLIAGDVAIARGPFRSSRDVGASGLLEAHGITARQRRRSPRGTSLSRHRAHASRMLETWRDWGRTTGFHSHRDPVLLRERADPRPARRPRRTRCRVAGHRRTCGAGEPGHADEVRASLRDRQFDPRAARPDRTLRPTAGRYRARPGAARLAVGASGDDGSHRGFHLFPFGGVRKAGTLAARRSSRTRAAGRRSHHAPCLRIRRAAPDCRPGSSCGSPRPAPRPEAGRTDGRRRSGTAASRRSACLPGGVTESGCGQSRAPDDAVGIGRDQRLRERRDVGIVRRRVSKPGRRPRSSHRPCRDLTSSTRSEKPGCPTPRSACAPPK